MDIGSDGRSNVWWEVMSIIPWSSYYTLTPIQQPLWQSAVALKDRMINSWMNARRRLANNHWSHNQDQILRALLGVN